MLNHTENKRNDKFKIVRYKPAPQGTPGAPGEDPTTDYMNVLGMIFSMCGLMMRWCSWVSHLLFSCISFANSRTNDDTKQMLSSFMLSISAVVMSYLQNPQPMTPPWSNI
ncbi:Protein Asterix [Armadillidium vulgare]|nr:Protein Asterix [Armadillidium vulgare]